MHKALTLFSSLVLFVSSFSLWAENLKWPNNAKAAVSLSYDDALTSQVQSAIPALNKYNLKGTFYVPGANDVLFKYLAQWKQAAKDGHELANHTLYHGCNGKQHKWVKSEYDLTQRSVRELVSEVRAANFVLHLIDGKSERTFTAPCVDPIASGENYVQKLTKEFVGIKASYSVDPIPLNKLNLNNVPIWAPSEVSGEVLINYVKQAAKINGLASITFHGIGGDHLSVSTQAHETLLAYLAENQDIYWTDTFLNISKHVQKIKK